MRKSKHQTNVKEWAVLYKSGVPLREIAKRYGSRHSVVTNNLKKIGVFKPISNSNAAKNFNPLDRYNSLVIKNDTGCWGWVGSVQTKGYGMFRASGKKYLAHRFSYEIHKGETLNKCVCHTCDNRLCSNPDHLFLGTNQDNTLDMMIKGRHRNAKFCGLDVIKIKEALASGVSVAELSKLYKVERELISDIKFGKTWKFV